MGREKRARETQPDPGWWDECASASIGRLQKALRLIAILPLFAITFIVDCAIFLLGVAVYERLPVAIRNWVAAIVGWFVIIAVSAFLIAVFGELDFEDATWAWIGAATVLAIGLFAAVAMIWWA